MSSTSYTMWYWRSTSIPSADPNRLVTQSVRLIEAAKSELNNREVLVMPSIDKNTGGQQTSIEIAIFFPTSYIANGRLNRATISEMLTRKARNLHLGYGNFVVQDKQDVRSFSSEELKRIFAAATSSSDWVVTAARAASAGIPAGEAKGSFLIADWRVERLRNARGDDIEKEIKSVLDGFKPWENEKSAWAAILMIGSGVAVVVSTIKYYAVLQSVTALVALGYVGVTMEFVAAGAIFSAIAPWAAALGVVIAMGVLALKGASNILLVVNDTSSQIVRRSHDVPNGITKAETPVIESRTKAQPNGAGNFASVGIYAYSKDETFGIPFSFFGSLIGVSFSLSEMKDGPSFSVGMDCPNSVMGGRNSITLVGWNDPSGVADLANKGHDEERSCKIAKDKVKVVARRAAEMGSINWGVCIATEEL